MTAPAGVYAFLVGAGAGSVLYRQYSVLSCGSPQLFPPLVAADQPDEQTVRRRLPIYSQLGSSGALRAAR